MSGPSRASTCAADGCAGDGFQERLLAAHWDRCAPWLQAALDRSGNTHALEDVRAAVRAGAATFWPGRACCLVTEVVQYPRKRVAVLWLAGGDLRELCAMAGFVRRWAKDNGCDRMQITGRPGWQRVLGARAAGTILTEEL